MSFLGAEPHAAPALPEDELQRFLDFFYRRTGIQFGASKRYFVERRLHERLRVTGAACVQDYLLSLRADQAGEGELQQLINAMTVNETYFYREEYQLRCLVAQMLPACVAARPGRPLRIWSLPCSTGEEPYSIALYLLANWPALADIDVEIIGSDIDTTVLARARQGVFDARSVQHLPAETLRAHFEARPSGQWRISPMLREAVRFSHVNLADEATMRSHRGQYDVIFCRNLLIYFDDRSRRQAADSLFEALRPGGFLCLGHAESMSRISSLFTVRKFSDGIVYQRPET